MKQKKWKYHKWHRFFDLEDNREVFFQTQLYKIGVYGILNNDSAYQFCYSPADIVTLERRFKKQEKEGKIKDSVTVSLIDFEDNATNPLIRTIDNFAKTLTPIVYLDNEYFMVETFETESDTVTYYRFYPEINNVEEYQELLD